MTDFKKAADAVSSAVTAVGLMGGITSDTYSQPRRLYRLCQQYVALIDHLDVKNGGNNE